MSAEALASLIAELPEGVVVTDPDIVASYRQDRAFDPTAGTALAVVRPRRTEEVQTVMRWATANKIAVVPRGMGTGLSGGANALDTPRPWLRCPAGSRAPRARRRPR